MNQHVSFALNDTTTDGLAALKAANAVYRASLGLSHSTRPLTAYTAATRVTCRGYLTDQFSWS